MGRPKHLRDMGVIKNKLKSLKKAGFIILHKKGEQVSLNYTGKTRVVIDKIINVPRTDDILN